MDLTQNIATIVREHGRAIRHAHGDSMDGDNMDSHGDFIASWIMARGASPLTPEEMATIRGGLSLCPKGGGHWDCFCKDYNC